jgi:ribose-phosphate pyrophosphokinase
VAATEAIAVAGADRLVVVNPHVTEFEAISLIPVETLTAVAGTGGCVAASTLIGRMVEADQRFWTVRRARHGSPR